MFTATNEQLIEELIKKTRYSLQAAGVFREQDLALLQARNSPDSWNVLECLEHLNRYGNFYHPQIAASLAASKYPASSQSVFTSGWLGQKMTQAMQPGGKGIKMKTFRAMNPIGSPLDASVVDTFIAQQNTLLSLLPSAKQSNLQKISCPTTLAPWLRLRLGDVLRLVVFHNQRHVEQAERILSML